MDPLLSWNSFFLSFFLCLIQTRPQKGSVHIYFKNIPYSHKDKIVTKEKFWKKKPLIKNKNSFHLLHQYRDLSNFQIRSLLWTLAHITFQSLIYDLFYIVGCFDKIKITAAFIYIYVHIKKNGSINRYMLTCATVFHTLFYSDGLPIPFMDLKFQTKGQIIHNMLYLWSSFPLL